MQISHNPKIFKLIRQSPNNENGFRCVHRMSLNMWALFKYESHLPTIWQIQNKSNTIYENDYANKTYL